MLSKLRSWLQRNRRWAFALSAIFILFEASRAIAIGQTLLPRFSEDMNEQIAIMLSHPPLIMATVAILAIVFFVVPMAGVIYAGIRIRRRVSRYWTGLNHKG